MPKFDQAQLSLNLHVLLVGRVAKARFLVLPTVLEVYVHFGCTTIRP